MNQSLKGVLEEELRRLKAAEQSYRRELASQSRGSIQKKKIKGKVYPYLVYRKADRVISKYLGALPSAEFKRIEGSIALRRKYQRMLKEVVNNKKELMRVVYGRKKAV